MWEVILDALLDTLKVLPFLIIIYIVIELIEHKTEIAGANNRLNGKLAPLFGAATGLIPQCGFSVMAAKLYENGFIKLGTLVAIFVSTSDEAFVILLSSGTAAMRSLLYMIVIKVIAGVAVGYIINAFCKEKAAQGEEGSFDYKTKFIERKFECTSCGHRHDESRPVMTYFVFPLLHSLKIAAYILIVNVIFGAIIYFVGTENLSVFLQKSLWAQPFIAAAVGLIPNCAGSVVITETYLMGGITFGSCMAGLCTNAGLGLVILLKNTKKWKRNIAIVALMYFIGVVMGLVINLFTEIILA